MKIILKCLVLCFCINLVGCIGTANRLWNSGPYISPAERKASHECIQAFWKISPPPPQPISPEVTHSEESRRRTDESYKFHTQCMKEKGFKK